MHSPITLVTIAFIYGCTLLQSTLISTEACVSSCSLYSSNERTLSDLNEGILSSMGRYVLAMLSMSLD